MILFVLTLSGCFGAGFGLRGTRTQTRVGASGDENVERYRVPIEGAPVMGTGQTVTIVAFTDMQCRFCGRASRTLDTLLERYPNDVRIVLRHKPLRFHRLARPAARLLVFLHEALGDEAAWEFHHRVFEQTRGRLSQEALLSNAIALGADAQQVEALLTGDEYNDRVDADLTLARSLGVRGTPHFFVNGRPIAGARPIEEFEEIIREELEIAARSAQPSQDWYAAIQENAQTARRAPRRARAESPERDLTVYQVPIDGAASQGSAEALVTMVAFSDFECPYCGRAASTIEALRERYGNELRVIFRHRPMPFHRHASLAHQAAIEARSQRGDSAFFEMHDLLFQNRRRMTRPDLERYASQLGLDLPRFRGALNDERHRVTIDADIELADRLGARGTPTFFINGRLLRGARPLDEFVEVIDERLADAQRRLGNGTPRDELYEAIVREGQARVPTRTRRRRRRSRELNAVPEVLPHNPTRGDGAITIQIFSDFECPFCSRVISTLERIEETYEGQVRLVFRHHPLSSHAHANAAANAAQEVRRQLGDEGFWRFHDSLFAHQDALGERQLVELAATLGADGEEVLRAIREQRFQDEIEADQAASRSAGLGSTPSFIVGNRTLVGAQPYERFRSLIDDALANASGPSER